jgi:hypothetical protein
MPAWELDRAAEAGRRARRDDFVLHDDFLSLFPQYWASVPLGFDYVVVGQIPRHFDTGNYTVQGAAQSHSGLAHGRRQPRRCKGDKPCMSELHRVSVRRAYQAAP